MVNVSAKLEPVIVDAAVALPATTKPIGVVEPSPINEEPSKVIALVVEISLKLNDVPYKLIFVKDVLTIAPVIVEMRLAPAVAVGPALVVKLRVSNPEMVKMPVFAVAAVVKPVPKAKLSTSFVPALLANVIVEAPISVPYAFTEAD